MNLDTTQVRRGEANTTRATRLRTDGAAMTKTENCRNDVIDCETEFSDFLAAEPATLWLKAAATLALYGNQSPEDVVELIGPYQDPDLYACVVAILTSPGEMASRRTEAAPIPGFDWGLPANDDAETALSGTTR